MLRKTMIVLLTAATLTGGTDRRRVCAQRRGCAVRRECGGRTWNGHARRRARVFPLEAISTSPNIIPIPPR